MADYNVNNVGIEFVASVEKAIASLDKLITKTNEAKGSMGGIVDSAKKASKGIDDIQKPVKDLKPQFTSLGEVIKGVFSTALLYRFGRMLLNFVMDSATSAADFVENYNLFAVALGNSSDEALKFQYAMNQAFGTSMSETLKAQGFLNNLATSLGITSDAALTMSTNLTKLAYDLSSLFNIGVDEAISKLESGIVGQTKPLRYVGIDVTMQTLQTYLDNMGIDRQVQQLTQAEKVLLRYIAILDQSGNAQGDFARTIESPNNQLKILGNQVKEIQVWFGNLFLGLFSSVLPVINGVAMAIKEVIKSFAILIGYELPDFGYDDLATGSEEAEEGINKVTTALKKQLRSFDEINNISENSGASGLGADSSIYDDLIAKIGSYESGMESVSMRATEIRNKILEWLGFTVETDKATGELKVKFDKLTVPMAIIAGFVVLMSSAAVVGGITALGKALSFIFAPLIAAGTAVGGLPFLIAGAITAVLGVIVFAYNKFSWFRDWVQDFGEKSGKVVYDIYLGFKRTFEGIALLIKSPALAFRKFINFMVEGLNKFKIKVPDWLKYVPGLGDMAGKEFGFNLQPIREWASGGFPSMGEMFIAREKGPEMVGSIGGRTAVANNDQIVSAIEGGVYNAMISAMGSSGGSQPINLTVQIGSSKVADTVVDLVNDSIQRGKVIYI